METAFMVARCAEQSCAAPRNCTAIRPALPAELRSDVTGAIARSLMTAVPSVAGRRLAKLPRSLDPDDVAAPACDVFV